MTVATALWAAFLLLLLGDFVATFGYHVPEHVFGRFHSAVHHSPDRSFIRYALRYRQPTALLDGFLSAFPYFMFIPWLWPLSPWGVVLGLCLGELHVIWRHQFSPAYRTPAWLQTLCQALGLSTPERHRQHHQNARLAYGDIFAFYGAPARWWLKQLMGLKKTLKQSPLA
ncbi:MAG TPA: sterol desaturase family protein [Trichocoleus sp.]